MSSSSSSKKRSKSLPVCEGCRIRKIRCDSDEAGCQQCRIIGLDCVRTPAVKFRYDLGNKSSDGRAFPSRQVWTVPKSSLRYHDETPELIDFYTGGTSTYGYDSKVEPENPGPDAPAEAHLPAQLLDDLDHDILTDDRGASSSATKAEAFTQAQPPTNTDYGFLSTTSPATGSQANQSPWGQSIESEFFDPHLHPAQPLSETEAILLRNYTDNMALWADGPDPSRSFELDASRRALTDLVLRHAICAFSSRHMNRTNPDRDAQALEYQDLCLKLLIPAISGAQPITDGVLAAVAILRQNEEMDDFDNRFHLEGVNRILNDVSAFASEGGLGEATAWLCLREDIYVSLVTQTPLRSSLVAFRTATWIQGDSDTAWANRMVLLLAELLSHAFADATRRDSLADVTSRIQEWDMLKPLSFNPIYFSPRHVAAGRHLPEVWMLGAAHAIGLQYYHIAQLVLAVSARVPSSRPFEHIHEHRAVERQVRHHLLRVVGIAKSNESVQNTWFTAHHCLVVWGSSLRKSGDQQACLDFLQKMESKIGWRVERLTQSLLSQWQDDSD